MMILMKKFTKKLVKEYIKTRVNDSSYMKNLIFVKRPPNEHSDGYWYWYVYNKTFPYTKPTFQFVINDDNIIVRINESDPVD